MNVIPYLYFKGQCKEAFQFYEQCLDGKTLFMVDHVGSPMENDVAPEWKDKILHAHMKIGEQDLMASDCPADLYKTPQGLNVSLHFDTVNEAERIFHALAEGGNIDMPFAETFWAKGFGMVTDKFGTPWMINCSVECQQGE